MLLAVDVGNTNIVFALAEGDKILWQWRIANDARRTADQYSVWLHQLMEMEGIPRQEVGEVIIASVVPQTLFNLRGFARRYVGVEPLVVGSTGFQFGMPINLPNPLEVGADRIVNAVAAHKKWPGDLIIVDFGTATTFDVVSADGVYEGGVIAPGINLSIDALYVAAAKLPRVAVEPPRKGFGYIGKSTVHAMQTGIFWGHVSLIEGLVGRIKEEINRPATVIGTGGLASLFGRHTSAFQHVDTDLTIDGLILLNALNRGEKN